MFAASLFSPLYWPLAKLETRYSVSGSTAKNGDANPAAPVRYSSMTTLPLFAPSNATVGSMDTLASMIPQRESSHMRGFSSNPLEATTTPGGSSAQGSSHTSPLPSWSESFWSGLYSSGQLSSSSHMPSPSVSAAISSSTT